MASKAEQAVAEVLARLRGFPGWAFVSEDGREELFAWAREVIAAAQAANSFPQKGMT